MTLQVAATVGAAGKKVVKAAWRSVELTV